MSSLDEYRNKYRDLRFERRDGVLQVTLHSDGARFVFNEPTHHDLGFAFADIADDPKNRVVILTGSGDRFCADFDYASFINLINKDPGDAWIRIRADGRRMLQAFLDIEVPVIAAINGPVVTHSELPLLADVVVAADTTVFQDATHFLAGLPPADGMHVVWTTLLGLNRGRYFLMTGQTIDAAEAQRLGVVGEVLPADRVLDRAWELAEPWAQFSRQTLHGTRASLTFEWKRLLMEQLHTGLTHESLAAIGVGKMEIPEPFVVDLLPAG
jgi:enoyl-CoA hydratase/carnithine racemase